MATEAEIATAARAMQRSRAWPAVFGAGTAELLARVALDAAERVRRRQKPAADARAAGIATGSSVDHGDR